MERYGANRGPLLAGAIKRPITPTIKGRRVFIAGDEPIRQASDIHDELWARALILRAGDSTLVMVALDLFGLSREHVSHIQEQAIEQGLPAQNLIISCTRNHSGPDTDGPWSTGWLGSGLNMRYIYFLYRELVDMIRIAEQSLQPVRPYLVRETIRDPLNEESLRELAVMQLRTAEDRSVATLVNVGLVPQTLGAQNTSISADFAHYLYQDLEAWQARDQVVLYTCAEGEEVIPSALQAPSWDQAERAGRNLAQAVRDSLENAEEVEIDHIRMWTRAIEPNGNGRLPKWLQPIGGSRNGSSAAHSKLALVELGPARIAVLPGLPAPEISLQVRRMVDAPFRFVVGMGNDNIGYIPPQQNPEQASRQTDKGTHILDEFDRLLFDAQQPDTPAEDPLGPDTEPETIPVADPMQELDSSTPAA